MTRHSTKPWQQEGLCIDNADGKIIAACYFEECSSKQAIANAALIVRAVNSHDSLVEALKNARSIVRAFTGNLLRFTKADADAGTIDAVAWTVQQEIEAALAVALSGNDSKGGAA